MHRAAPGADAQGAERPAAGPPAARGGGRAGAAAEGGRPAQHLATRQVGAGRLRWRGGDWDPRPAEPPPWGQPGSPQHQHLPSASQRWLHARSCPATSLQPAAGRPGAGFLPSSHGLGPGSGLLEAACSEPRGLVSGRAARWGQAPAMPHVSVVPHTCSTAARVQQRRSRSAAHARLQHWSHCCPLLPSRSCPTPNPVPMLPDAFSPPRLMGWGAQDTAVPVLDTSVSLCSPAARVVMGLVRAACCPVHPQPGGCPHAGPTRHGWAVRGLRVGVRRQLGQLLLLCGCRLPAVRAEAPAQ